MKIRSKDNNQFKIDHAFPGLCSLCHVEIAEFNGSHANGRPIITKLKGNWRETSVLLDDGSAMRVSLCSECYDNFSSDDAQYLMESEINGWQDEIDRCCKTWPEERRISYMKKYSKKFIKNRVDKNWSPSDIARIKKPRADKLRVKTGA